VVTQSDSDTLPSTSRHFSLVGPFLRLSQTGVLASVSVLSIEPSLVSVRAVPVVALVSSVKTHAHSGPANEYTRSTIADTSSM
jgi:hypothetical protein